MKLFDEEWKNYRAVYCAPELPDELLEELKQAFVCGALSLMRIENELDEVGAEEKKRLKASVGQEFYVFMDEYNLGGYGEKH